jgi:predicted dehydrogenase
LKFAIVGCGYVADFYLATLANHPELQLAGVYDHNAERLKQFAQFHGIRSFPSLDTILSDPAIPLVANLTNPRSHFEVSSSCLAAGKHVYSEKPLATEWPRAVELVELAESKGLRIVSAPCTVLGEAAQTLWKRVREGAIGPVRLAYAELDDGLLHKEPIRTWRSASGNPWPYQDELEIGCTLEHAGYFVTWLCAMFGPATQVVAHASQQLPDKLPGESLSPSDTPDFSCGLIQFASGTVARITCSIIAPHDHSLRLFGEKGTLSIQECWNMGSPIHLDSWTKWSFRARKHPRLARLAGLGPKRIPLVRKPEFKVTVPGANQIDFCRGIDELARSIRESRACRISPRFSLHANEIVLTLHDPRGMGSPRKLETTFEPLDPMPWAR